MEIECANRVSRNRSWAQLLMIENAQMVVDDLKCGPDVACADPWIHGGLGLAAWASFENFHNRDCSSGCGTFKMIILRSNQTPGKGTKVPTEVTFTFQSCEYVQFE